MHFFQDIQRVNGRDSMGICLLNFTFILFPRFDTAFQNCMTLIISLLVDHTFVSLVLMSLPNSSPVSTISLFKSSTKYHISPSEAIDQH